MSNETTAKKTAQWIQIALVIGLFIWALSSCDQQQDISDAQIDEMRGRGMLEEKGFVGDLPPNAGRDYVMMLENSEYKSDDFATFFRQLKIYNFARTELQKRGLSESDLSKIPEWELYKAMDSSSPEKELDRLAKQYD
jgi:hypothetical protein